MCPSKQHRKYLQICVGGKRYQFKALPFGLNIAPQTFTRVLKAALLPLRKKGIRMVAYLDDICIVAESEGKAAKHGMEVVTHLENLGFIINTKKTCLNPKQYREFLGLMVNSTRHDSFRSERETTKDQTRSIADLAGRNMATTKSSSYHWPYELGLQSNEKWSDNDQSSLRRHEKDTLPRKLLERETSENFTGIKGRIGMVDPESCPIQRETVSRTPFLERDMDRCVRQGMGSSVRGRSGPGSLDPKGEGVDVQPEGEPGDPERVRSVHRSATGQRGEDTLRQYDGGIERGPPGGYPLSSDLGPDEENLGIRFEKPNVVDDSTHSRLGQRSSGPSQQDGPAEGRILPLRSGNPKDINSTGNTNNRLICLQEKQPMSEPRDERRGRVQFQLEGPRTSIDPPTSEVDPEDLAKDRRRQSQEGNSRDAELAKPPILSSHRSDENIERCMSEERRLGHDKRISIMEGKCVLNDSTDYLRAHFSERYKTNEGLELLVKSVKDSTARAYAYAWKRYINFCKKNVIL